MCLTCHVAVAAPQSGIPQAHLPQCPPAHVVEASWAALPPVQISRWGISSPAPPLPSSDFRQLKVYRQQLVSVCQLAHTNQLLRVSPLLLGEWSPMLLCVKNRGAASQATLSGHHMLLSAQLVPIHQFSRDPAWQRLPTSTLPQLIMLPIAIAPMKAAQPHTCPTVSLHATPPVVSCSWVSSSA